MQCTVLRDFSFSTDGINTRQAVAGQTADIPDALVPGLKAEGYVSVGGAETSPAEAKAVSAAPENKAIETALENKGPDSDEDIAGLATDVTTVASVANDVAKVPEPDEHITAVRERYQEVVGKKPYHGWDIDQLKAKIAEAKNA